MDPAPFLRGLGRYRPDDRLPRDTLAMARIPVGLRIELQGDAHAIDITYRTATDQLGYRGDGAGRTFRVWEGCEEPAELGEAKVRLPLRELRSIVYLPEGMRPEILDIEPVGGPIEPAPPSPRWICYGDSIAEGWCASGPSMAWPAIVAREHDLDVVNMGYAGAARGEIATAEYIAELPADVISITYGTNCWTRTPHTVGQFRENLSAFLAVVRQGHPDTPVVLAGPILRPDAETTPNRLGATLQDLRGIMEEVPGCMPGRDVVTADQLVDGIHPGDDGHRAIAGVLGPAIAAKVR